MMLSRRSRTGGLSRAMLRDPGFAATVQRGDLLVPRAVLRAVAEPISHSSHAEVSTTTVRPGLADHGSPWMMRHKQCL